MDAPIGDLIAERARTDPTAVLLVDAATGSRLTAADLDGAASDLAMRLTDVGVRRDDTISLALPTSPSFVVAVVAVWRVGATPFPLPPDLSDDERGHLDRLARPAAVIGTPGPDPAVPVVTPQSGGRGRAGETTGLWASSWKATTSSGSTGTRKVVRSTTPARFDPRHPVAPFLPSGSTQLVTADLWHSAAFTYAFRGLMTDHRLVLAARTPAADLPDVVRRHGVTWTMMSPSLIRRVLRVPAATRGTLPTLGSLVHLGAPCSEADKRALIDWLGPDRVVEIYASSESFGVTMITGREWLDHPGSVGRGIGGTEIAVRDDDGHDLPAGMVGTVWMRRPGAARYRYDGVLSARTDDGWDTAGDLGYIDDDGLLFLTGRSTDRRTCGDGLVDLARVEAELLESSDVLECLVHPSPDHRLDATLTVTAGATPEGVTTFTRVVLARHCHPGRIVLRRGPIRDRAGKARRPA